MLRQFLLLGLAAIGTTAVSLPHNLKREPASDANTASPSLHAGLSQINATHCNLTLTNEGSTSIDLLKWNSVFDTRAEQFSFSIHSTTTNQTLAHGPNTLRKIYGDVQASHIVTFAAHSSWNGTFDLTELFEVPTEGDYIVAFSSTLIALTSTAKLQDSYRIPVKSQSMTMKLAKSSPPSITPRGWLPDLSDNARIHTCDAAQKWVIQQVTASAAGLAKTAFQAVPTENVIVGYHYFPDLYRLYFNDNSQSTVAGIFNKISQYDLMKSPGLGLTWYCSYDPHGFNDCAVDGVLGYAPAYGAYAYITLCPIFFSSTWSSALCAQPGTQNPPAGTTVAEWQQAFMQPGVILHEMMHSFLISGTSKIVDGPDFNEQGGDNYLYKGATALAAAAATNGDAPLTNSQNFVFFAQAVANRLAPDSQCNCCSLGGPTLGLCKNLPNSPACGACTCGDVAPNPPGSG